MNDKKYWIWLSSIPGIGNVRFFKLIEHFKTARNVFEATEEELSKVAFLPSNVLKQIVSNRDINKIEKYLNKVKENDIKVYTIEEENYPENLKNIYDPPPILYVRGELKNEDKYSIAIVGSRKASDYGIKSAHKLSKELSELGITVVSGMALGIDSQAHRGAINGGGRTIAVFACGLNHVYPPSGVNLAKEIIKNGAIISEYPIGMQPMPGNFPARNRIISGISLGTLIVEAGERSGSLITADFANEQGREVFALPGNISSPNSRGTNGLIKNGAKLVQTVDDIICEFKYISYFEEIVPKQIELDLESDEEVIMKCFDSSGKTIDQIIDMTKKKASDIISKITILEIKGAIYKIDGFYYKS